MYFHERVTQECTIFIYLILVKYLLDDYFRSRAATYVLI